MAEALFNSMVKTAVRIERPLLIKILLKKITGFFRRFTGWD